MKTALTLTQDTVTGNFNISGELNPAKTFYRFFNGRFDGLNSATWVNKAMIELKHAPSTELGKKQVGVIYLDLGNGTLTMKGSDYNRIYSAKLVNNQIII